MYDIHLDFLFKSGIIFEIVRLYFVNKFFLSKVVPRLKCRITFKNALPIVKLAVGAHKHN